MRIISNFRDYYDSLMAYDSDRDIIYKRTEVVHENYVYTSWYNYNGINIYPLCIGFCGEVFLGVHIQYRVQAYPESELVSYYCYDKSKVMELINSNNENIVRPLYSYKLNDKYHRKEAIRDTECAFTQTGVSNIFSEYNCPIFVAKASKAWNNKGKLRINTNIGRYEFQKVLDPYTAYQKLKTYVEGMAQPLRPIPELSDEVMQEIKGFDHKYSFRKEPSK